MVDSLPLPFYQLVLCTCISRSDTENSRSTRAITSMRRHGQTSPKLQLLTTWQLRILGLSNSTCVYSQGYARGWTAYIGQTTPVRIEGTSIVHSSTSFHLLQQPSAPLSMAFHNSNAQFYAHILRQYVQFLVPHAASRAARAPHQFTPPVLSLPLSLGAGYHHRYVQLQRHTQHRKFHQQGAQQLGISVLVAATWLPLQQASQPVLASHPQRADREDMVYTEQ